MQIKNQYVIMEIKSKISSLGKSVGDINFLVDIPFFVRLLVFVDFLVVHLALPLYISGLASLEDVYFFLLKSFARFLIILPVVFPFKGIGLLHPFVWPTLFVFAKSFKNFSYLFSQATLYVGSVAVPNSQDIILANYFYTTYAIIATLSVYVGYYLLHSNQLVKLPQIRIPPARYVTSKMVLLTAVCLVIAGIFFYTQGGVKAWIDSWGLAGGRSEAMEGKGPILRFVDALYFIPLLWMTVDLKGALRNPIFWLSVVLFTLSGFLATGTRYAILQALAFYLLAWVYVKRYIPIVPVVIGGVLMLILFGALGQYRASTTYTGRESDLSVLTEGSITDFYEAAIEESEWRNAENAHIAVFHKVPNQVDFLNGLSYASVLFWFVPRGIWPDKPHTGPYYCGEKIFGYGWGVPLNEVAEVYWNFYPVGFVLFFLFKGMLFSYLVRFFLVNRAVYGVVILYFFFLINGTVLDSIRLLDFFQEVIFFVLAARLLKFI